MSSDRRKKKKFFSRLLKLGLALAVLLPYVQGALNDVCVAESDILINNLIVLPPESEMTIWYSHFDDNREMITGMRHCETTDNKLFRSWAIRYVD